MKKLVLKYCENTAENRTLLESIGMTPLSNQTTNERAWKGLEIISEVMYGGLHETGIDDKKELGLWITNEELIQIINQNPSATFFAEANRFAGE